jgi:hypothetical protein
VSGNHTPTPWYFKEGDTTFQVWGEGDMRVAATSWHNSLRQPYPLMEEARANVTLIVTAVNSYASSQAEIERLRTALEELLAHASFVGIAPHYEDMARAALSGSKE